MKLSLVVAALMDADILLLDEPTNHLDKKSIEWLVAYLTTTRACCMIVSHDTAFLDAVCTDLFITSPKNSRYHDNLTEFVAKVTPRPLITARDNLRDMPPAPGRLEGLTARKAI